MVVHRRAGRNRAQSDGTPTTAGRRVEGTKTAAECTWRSDPVTSPYAAACSLERAREIVRKWRLDVDLRPRGRMGEAEPVRMQELSLEAEISLDAVRRVT